MITSGQLFAILSSAMIGTGILNISRTVAEVSRQDAWISTFLAGLAVTANTLIIYILASRFPSKTLAEYSQIIMGKWVGRLIVLIYIVYRIATAALVLRIMVELINTWFLPATPTRALIIPALLLLVYLARNGVSVQGRVNFFLFWLLLPLMLFTFPPVIQRPFFINLLPVGGTGFITIIKGMMPAIYSYLGFETLLMLFPYVQDKKNILKASISAGLLTTVVYTMVVTVQVAIYSYERLAALLYPLMRYISFIQMPFMERVEIFFIFFWVFAIFQTSGIQFFVTTLETGILLKKKDTKNISIFLTIPLYIIAMHPKNIGEIIELIGYIGYLGLVAALGLPVVLLVVAIIRGLKEEEYEKSSP